MAIERLRMETLRLQTSGVDRKANVIRGYVVAKRGFFKTPGLGQFTNESLLTIVKLMKSAEPRGLKSHFTHPGWFNDGLGTFLGRVRNPRLADGEVLADLHLSPAAFNSPRGNLGNYILDLAESDPAALASSLVLHTKKLEAQENGKPLLGPDGRPQPPIWMPTQLHASDLVDEGEATDGLLSARASKTKDAGVLRRRLVLKTKMF